MIEVNKGVTMNVDEFKRVGQVVENHLTEDLDEFSALVNRLYGLTETDTRQLVIGFLTTSLCNGKIMLKKETEDGT